MPSGVYQHRKWTEEEKKKRSFAYKGRKLSKETKKKIGLKSAIVMKKKWQDPIYRKMMSEKHKGKKLPFAQRKKMSESHTGKKHWNWKGGITPVNNTIRKSIESRLWRESVFARDNWTCQKCRKRGIYLTPHHIQNFAQYPELRFVIDNGITLCKECHKLFHKRYGRRNNTIEQIILFLNTL